LKRRKRSKNRTPDPHRILALWRCNNFHLSKRNTDYHTQEVRWGTRNKETGTERW
jgi:hypothetical protein